MLICPKCKCEYRDGFKNCADCNSLLVEGRAQENNSSYYSKSGYVVASLIINIVLCIILSIFIDTLAVGLIFVGLLFIILGYFWMQEQTTKDNTIDSILSILFIDPNLSGIGSIIFGVLILLGGIIIGF